MAAEFDLIARHFAPATPVRADVAAGIGDDAALLLPPAGVRDRLRVHRPPRRGRLPFRHAARNPRPTGGRGRPSASRGDRGGRPPAPSRVGPARPDPPRPRRGLDPRVRGGARGGVPGGGDPARRGGHHPRPARRRLRGARPRPPLARKIHRCPAADANLLAVAGRTPSSRFNVVSTTCCAQQSLLRLQCGQSIHGLPARRDEAPPVPVRPTYTVFDFSAVYVETSPMFPHFHKHLGALATNIGEFSGLGRMMRTPASEAELLERARGDRSPAPPSRSSPPPSGSRSPTTPGGPRAGPDSSSKRLSAHRRRARPGRTSPASASSSRRSR